MARRFDRRVNFRHFASAALLLGLAGIAVAQDPESYNAPQGPFHQPAPQLPAEYGFSQDHSSTLAESVQRGRAALIQAYGNYQINRQHARILAEQAAWQEHQHDMQWRAQRDEMRQARADRKILAQQKLADRRATLYRQTYQLSANELNRNTGEINWPELLQAAKYQPARERVNELFRTHVAYGEPQAGTADAIARAVAPIVQSLRQDIGNLPRDEYLAAQKFLVGLKYEAKSMVAVS
jgi:hypothetical protein